MQPNWRKLRERQGMSRLCLSQYLECSLDHIVAVEDHRLEFDDQHMQKLGLLHGLRLKNNPTVASNSLWQFLKKLNANLRLSTKGSSNRPG